MSRKKKQSTRPTPFAEYEQLVASGRLNAYRSAVLGPEPDGPVLQFEPEALDRIGNGNPYDAPDVLMRGGKAVFAPIALIEVSTEDEEPLLDFVAIDLRRGRQPIIRVTMADGEADESPLADSLTEFLDLLWRDHPDDPVRALERTLAKARSAWPEDAATTLRLTSEVIQGGASLTKGQSRRADDLVLQALELRANTLRSLGRPDDAAADLQRASTMGGTGAGRRLVEHLLNVGESKRALKVFANLPTSELSAIEICLTQARIYLALGNEAEARHECERLFLGARKNQRDLAQCRGALARLEHPDASRMRQWFEDTPSVGPCTPAQRARDRSWWKGLSKDAQRRIVRQRGFGKGPLGPEQIQEVVEKLDVLRFFEVDKPGDLEALVHLRALRCLGVSRLPTPTLEFFLTMPALEELTIFRSAITDLRPLEVMSKLRVLGLKDNAVQDIEPLRALTDLEVLDVTRNPLTHVDAVAGLRRLRVLALGGTKVMDLRPISGLTELEELFLVDVPARDLTPLVSCPKLEIVRCAGVSPKAVKAFVAARPDVQVDT